MKKIVVSGGRKLYGNVKISGAKNAAVAILPASILSEEKVVIENIPDISDISLMCKILEQLGAEIKVLGKHELEIDAKNVSNCEADFEDVKHMRASCYLLGALLGKFGNSCIAMPGGCNFELRPIDQHIKGFSILGSSCEISGGFVTAKAKKLVGGNVYFDIVSVGATINLILAAVKASGVTTIENAAKEPHVVDVANFLNSMGADIRGAGTDLIKIKGVKHLKGTSYSIIPDQIEAGTYLAAVTATGGNITIENIIPKHLEPIAAKLEEIGAKIKFSDDSVSIVSNGNLNKCNVKTMPYPGFPTDMQPQITAILTQAIGTSVISESVWDHRFKYVSELVRMGAKILVDGRVAIIEGKTELTGANVKAADLRAGAALIISGLISKGTTVIGNINFIERGYEGIVEKLSNLGADIKLAKFENLNNVTYAAG
ncbi:MAG: UDP-N-acetylglucosamine 1-carboxyvinyltransferase [Oscillospiraceae bacterium]|nr:UDP-N-acetylglucosamine 1-carboxyvinyltransferase [Oscillospiraceae bacterium]